MLPRPLGATCRTVRRRNQIVMLGDWAPSLEELCAADNDLSDVKAMLAAHGQQRVRGFRCLRSLDISETRLTSWDQVHQQLTSQKGRSWRASKTRM